MWKMNSIIIKAQLYASFSLVQAQIYASFSLVQAHALCRHSILCRFFIVNLYARAACQALAAYPTKPFLRPRYIAYPTKPFLRPRYSWCVYIAKSTKAVQVSCMCFC